jgi:hypothetical protein
MSTIDKILPERFDEILPEKINIFCGSVSREEVLKDITEEMDTLGLVQTNRVALS